MRRRRRHSHSWMIPFAARTNQPTNQQQKPTHTATKHFQNCFKRIYTLCLVCSLFCVCTAHHKYTVRKLTRVTRVCFLYTYKLSSCVEGVLTVSHALRVCFATTRKTKTNNKWHTFKRKRCKRCWSAKCWCLGLNNAECRSFVVCQSCWIVLVFVVCRSCLPYINKYVYNMWLGSRLCLKVRSALSHDDANRRCTKLMSSKSSSRINCTQKSLARSDIIRHKDTKIARAG